MPYIVVFDTCALENNLNPESPSWIQFRAWRESVGAQVCIPQAVWIEFRKHVRKDQLERISQVLKYSFDRSKLTLFQIFDEPADQQEFQDNLMRDIDAKLDGAIKSRLTKLFGLSPSILKAPNISHTEFLQKYYVGERRPFFSNNSYGDSLIWESVLELLSTKKNAKIIFVSPNGADFRKEKPRREAQGKEKEAKNEDPLHPDLIADVHRIRTGTNYKEHIEYYFSVRSMVDELDLGKIPPDALDEFKFGSKGWRNIQEYLVNNRRQFLDVIIPQIPYDDLPKDWYRDTFGFENLTLIGVRVKTLYLDSPPTLLSIYSIRHLEDLKVLIQAKICSVFVCSYERLFRNSNSPEPIEVGERRRMALEMDFSLLWNLDSKAIESSECLDARVVDTAGIDIEIDKVNSMFDVLVKEDGRPRGKRTGLNSNELKELLEFVGANTQDLQIETLEAWRGYAANCPKPILDCLFPEIDGPQIVT